MIQWIFNNFQIFQKRKELLYFYALMLQCVIYWILLLQVLQCPELYINIKYQNIHTDITTTFTIQIINFWEYMNLVFPIWIVWLLMLGQLMRKRQNF